MVTIEQEIQNMTAIMDQQLVVCNLEEHFSVNDTITVTSRSVYDFGAFTGTHIIVGHIVLAMSRCQKISMSSCRFTNKILPQLQRHRL